MKSLLFMLLSVGFNSTAQQNSIIENISNFEGKATFYRFLDNEIFVQTNNENVSNIELSCSNCTIKQVDYSGKDLPKNKFIVQPGKESNGVFHITYLMNETPKTDSFDFCVRNLPYPNIRIGKKQDGDTLDLDNLTASINFPDSHLNQFFSILKLDMIVNSTTISTPGNSLSKEMIKTIHSSTSGTPITFSMTVEGNDGISRKIKATLLR